MVVALSATTFLFVGFHNIGKHLDDATDRATYKVDQPEVEHLYVPDRIPKNGSGDNRKTINHDPDYQGLCQKNFHR